MAKSIKVNPKKQRGRPATGRDPVSAVRFPADVTKAIDNWGDEHEIGRSEAIRRLVEIGLKAADEPKRRRTSKSSARAADLAGSVIDSRMAADTTNEEKATRKRQLLKGPSTFRDVRKDRTK